MNIIDHPRKGEAIDALARDLAHRMCYEAATDGYGFDDEDDADVAHFHDLGIKDATRYFETVAKTLDGTSDPA